MPSSLPVARALAGGVPGPEPKVTPEHVSKPRKKRESAGIEARQNTRDITGMAKKTHEPDDERVAGGVGQLKPTSVSAANRKRMRTVALKYRPWQYTRGPTTPEGKAKVAENGRYAQKNELSRRQLTKELSEAHTLLIEMAAVRKLVCPDEPAEQQD